MSGNVIMFPGQGSQSVGMGKDVAEASPAAAEIFRRADAALGFALSKICFEGPESSLAQTDIQQPAIFITSVAIWEALLETGATAEDLMGASAGLSLGEYTALYAAGSIGFEDGVKLVRRRGELMQAAAEATPSGMASVIGGDSAAVDALCADAAEGEVLTSANFNCPGQIVISGTQSACARAVERASKHGVRAISLKVAGAFHSAIMATAAEQLGPVLEATPMQQPRCPVVANVNAQPHGDPSSIRLALQEQVTHAVRWQDSIESLIEKGFDRFIEVGPGRVLTGLMRKINRNVQAINVSGAAAVDSEGLLAPAQK